MELLSFIFALEEEKGSSGSIASSVLYIFRRSKKVVVATTAAASYSCHRICNSAVVPHGNIEICKTMAN
jgi:hypothetical protein